MSLPHQRPARAARMRPVQDRGGHRQGRLAPESLQLGTPVRRLLTSAHSQCRTSSRTLQLISGKSGLTGAGDFYGGQALRGRDGPLWALETLRAGGRMGRPIIGITGELEAARWGNWIREAVVSPVSYTRAVERAGGT